MAITQEDIPIEFSAARQKLMTVASSDKTAEEKMRYIFKTTIDRGSGATDVSQYKIRANPDTLGVFDASVALKHLVYADILNGDGLLMFDMTDPLKLYSLQTYAFAQIQWQIGESYAPSSSEAPVDYDNLSNFQRYIFPERRKISDGYKSANTHGFMGSSGFKAFVEGETHHVTNDDHFLIPVINHATFAEINYTEYTIYFDSGSSFAANINNTTANGGGIGNTIPESLLYIRCGPKELSGITACTTAPEAAVDWQYYTIGIRDDAANLSAIYYFYNASNRSCVYDNWQLMYKNRFGFFSFISFFMKTKKRISVSKKQYQKTVGQTNSSDDYEFEKWDISKGIYGLVAKEIYTISSDWLTTAQSEEFEEHILSDQVYAFLNGSITPIPIVISKADFQTKTQLNDKLIKYSIDFEISQPLESW